MEYTKKEITVFDSNFVHVEKKARAKRRELEDEGWVYNESQPWTDGDNYYISLYFTKNEDEDKEDSMSKKRQKNIVVEWAKEIMNIAELAYDTSNTYKDEYLRQIIGSCKAITIALDCCDDKDS